MFTPVRPVNNLLTKLLHKNNNYNGQISSLKMSETTTVLIFFTISYVKNSSAILENV